MTTLVEELLVAAHPDAVWAAVSAFDDIHTRLMPGHVLATRMEGDCRILTMADGSTLREQLVGSDDARRRLAYTVKSSHLTHHNAALQVFDAGDGSSRLVWTVDVLPDAIAPLLAPGHAAALKLAADTLSGARS